MLELEVLGGLKAGHEDVLAEGAVEALEGDRPGLLQALLRRKIVLLCRPAPFLLSSPPTPSRRLYRRRSERRWSFSAMEEVGRRSPFLTLSTQSFASWPRPSFFLRGRLTGVKYGSPVDRTMIASSGTYNSHSPLFLPSPSSPFPHLLRGPSVGGKGLPRFLQLLFRVHVGF